ncbi:MAG: WecB/TagA/CpsF family glycosyltransferase [Planctomycetota bacterium]
MPAVESNLTDTPGVGSPGIGSPKQVPAIVTNATSKETVDGSSSPENPVELAEACVELAQACVELAEVGTELPAAGAEALAGLERCDIWQVPFDRVRLDQAVDRIQELVARGTPSYVITANLNYVMLHHQLPELQQVTRDADLILADGQPIVWRSRRTSQPLPERVAGSELIYPLAERASNLGWGVYFLGGQPGVAQTCAERLQKQFPGMRIAGVESPPYRRLTSEEQEQQIARIQQAKPELLLVAFGQPKGDLWIHEHFRACGVPVSIQLGASFDFIAGTAQRAPKIWQKLGMEWAYRMLRDPKRLVPRYVANAKFLFQQCCG